MLHSTAIISPGADLAEGVKVGPYSIIGNDVQIGAGTEIGSHVIIKGTTEIGENNRILQFASIGEDPQDKKYAGEKTRLVIGDGNTIREYCTLNRGTAQDIGVTRIGNNNWLMAYVHVAHDCHVGNHVILANNATLGGHVTVGDFAIIGGLAAVHQFARIGAHAMIGGMSGAYLSTAQVAFFVKDMSAGKSIPAGDSRRPTACCEKYWAPQPKSPLHSSAGAFSA